MTALATWTAIFFLGALALTLTGDDDEGGAA
jgi:hypothetical protein